MPLMGIHCDFEGKDREVECIKVFEKPQRKQIELELFSVIAYILKPSKQTGLKAYIMAQWNNLEEDQAPIIILHI